MIMLLVESILVIAGIFRVIDCLSMNTSPRVQSIKNVVLQNEVLRHILSSEFALRVEVKQKDTYIDYNRLIRKLDMDLTLLNQNFTAPQPFASSLIERIVEVREKLSVAARNDLLTMESNIPTVLDAVELSLEQSLDDSNADETYTNHSITENGNRSSSFLSLRREFRDGLRILVREDGSVDWEGALASGQLHWLRYRQFAKIHLGCYHRKRDCEVWFGAVGAIERTRRATPHSTALTRRPVQRGRNHHQSPPTAARVRGDQAPIRSHRRCECTDDRGAAGERSGAEPAEEQARRDRQPDHFCCTARRLLYRVGQ